MINNLEDLIGINQNEKVYKNLGIIKLSNSIIKLI